MSEYQFRLIRRDLREPRGAEVEQHLRERPVATQSGSLAATCKFYRPSQELEVAMHTAIAVGAPLLLTGQPGTGKTQAAYFAAWQRGLGQPLHFQAKTNSLATDLLYDFDTVRYFRDAHLQGLAGDKDASHLNKRDYIEPRPLWQDFAAAEQSGKPAVLSIETGNKPNVLNADLGKLPHLQVLIKTPEDRESIHKG